MNTNETQSDSARYVHLPKITVLTITCREMYLQEQYDALRKQTLRDFEWIIVDDLYEERNQEVRALSADIPIIHIPPREIVDYYATAMALNTGLTYANGNLVFFMTDYIIPQRDCLERHWEIYQKYKKVMISGLDINVEAPISILKEGGKYKGTDYRHGLFKDYFKKTGIDDNLYEAFSDGVKNWWAGRNDSAPLEALLACNGFDEQYDGGWGGQDSDMAHRLFTYGLRYLLDEKSVCLEFRRSDIIRKRLLRSDAEQTDFNRTIIQRKFMDKVYLSDNKYDLREAWCQKHLE